MPGIRWWDLNFNLAHARDQVVDAIPPSKGFFSMAFFWLPTVTQSELFWCFAILNLLLCAALLIRLFHRSEWLFYSLRAVPLAGDGAFPWDEMGPGP